MYLKTASYKVSPWYGNVTFPGYIARVMETYVLTFCDCRIQAVFLGVAMSGSLSVTDGILMESHHPSQWHST